MIRAAASRARHAASLSLLVLLSLSLAASEARAIPAFARKYGTSCITCHTVFPHLTPFGEAFRRNGFRFPGGDSNFWKQDVVELGQEAYKATFPKYVWPGVLPAIVPVGFGFNGQAQAHPDRRATARALDNDSLVTLKDLIAEAHLWAGGSFDSDAKINFFGEVTFTSDPAAPVNVEDARLLFNDLFGPPHLFNLVIGRGVQTLTSFGAHSSYVADTLMTPMATAALFGASNAWDPSGDYNGLEINGMGAGRFIYSLGVNTGDSQGVRPPETGYLHLGYKIGGIRLDGEGDFRSDPEKPWGERSFTVDLFAVYSKSHTLYPARDPKGNQLTWPAPPAGTVGAGTPGTAVPAIAQDNQAWVAGVNLRWMMGSLEWTAGLVYNRHDHAQSPRALVTDATGAVFSSAPGARVDALVLYNELSYIVFPWLVPALRVDWLRVSADGCDSTSFDCTADDVRITPGVAFLIRPNLRLVVSATYEWARGALNPSTGWLAQPAAMGLPVAASGWAASGGFATPAAKGQSASELETVRAFLQFAF